VCALCEGKKKERGEKKTKKKRGRECVREREREYVGEKACLRENV
jgi:hypothetical protein